MPHVIPSGKSLGCRIEGMDLSRPLSDADVDLILRSFGRHGVLCFPKQTMTPQQHKAFAARFGSLEVNVAAGHYTEPGHPEVMILSNIVENGKALGLADAGQDWHTDMSYSSTVAFLNCTLNGSAEVRLAASSTSSASRPRPDSTSAVTRRYFQLARSSLSLRASISEQNSRASRHFRCRSSDAR